MRERGRERESERQKRERERRVTQQPDNAALALSVNGDQDTVFSQCKNDHFTEMCCGNEEGSYLRLINACITHLEDQGPSRTCNESKEEESDNVALALSGNGVQDKVSLFFFGPPYNQSEGAPLKQLKGAPYNQLEGPPLKQLQGAPYTQLEGAPYNQFENGSLSLEISS